MMGNSKKNNTAAKLDSLHKLDQTPDSLLGDEEDLVYELIEEEEAITETSNVEEIKQLKHTQKSIRLQLDDAFLDIDKLARQFKKEKQARGTSLTSYIALMLAGIALILALGSIYFLSDAQESVDKLVRSIETLKNHNHTESGETIDSQIDDLKLKVDNLVDKQNTQTSTDSSAADDIEAKKNTPEDPLTFTGSGIPASTEIAVVPSANTNKISASDVKEEVITPIVSDSSATSTTVNNTPATDTTATETSDDKKEIVADPFSASTAPPALTTDSSVTLSTDTSAEEKTPTTDASTTKETEVVPVLATIPPTVDVSTANTSEAKTETSTDPLKKIESTPSAVATSLVPETPSEDASADKKETKTENSAETTTDSESVSLSDTLLKQASGVIGSSAANKDTESSALKIAETEASKTAESSTEPPVSLSDTLLKQENLATTAVDEKPVPTPTDMEKTSEAGKNDDKTEISDASVTTAEKTAPTAEKTSESGKNDDKTETSDASATTAEKIAPTDTEKTSEAGKNDDKTETSDASAEKTAPTLDSTEKAAETEKKDDAPEASASTKHGWVVILGSYKNLSRANRNMTAYNKAGFTTSVAKIRSGGRSWHQISTNAFNTRKEAKQYLRKVKQKVKIESSMIIRR